MNPILKISPLGLKVIKAYEGYRSEAKVLVTGQRVIGYGHVLADDEDAETMSRAEADARLITDLEIYENIVREHTYAPLNQGQFDALCSLVFNIGEEKFLNSNVIHALNNGRTLDAATGFDEWRKAEINGQVYVVDALMRRRTAEKALFLREHERVATAARGALIVESDSSYADVSGDTDVFNPDTGIVDYVPYNARPAPSRRREDTPLGLFGLSETAERTSEERSIFDPQTKAILQAEGLELDSPVNAELPSVTETKTEEPLLLDNVIPTVEAPPATLEDENVLLSIPSVNSTEPQTQNTLSDLQKSAEPSPIAIAAAQVSDRLDALIDGAKLEPMVISNVNSAKPNAGLNEESASTVRVAANNNNTVAKVETNTVRGAESFIQKKDEKGKKKKRPDTKSFDAAQSGGGVYAVFMFIGGCLLASGLVTLASRDVGLDGATSLLVPMSLGIGAIMIVGSLYYMLKFTFRPH